MNNHPVDVLSAVFGVLAVSAGAVVVSGAVDPFEGADVGVWITVAALALGLLMLPWGRGRASARAGSDDLVSPSEP